MPQGADRRRDSRRRPRSRFSVTSRLSARPPLLSFPVRRGRWIGFSAKEKGLKLYGLARRTGGETMPRRCYSTLTRRASEGIRRGARTAECGVLSAGPAPFRIPASARRAAPPWLAIAVLMATFLTLSVCRGDEQEERQR